jgi:molybdopterin-guanine dinucleotide biosynthesis protein A
MRFGGRNKALMKLGERTILERTLSSFGDLFPEIMVVTNAPLSYLSFDGLIVTDILPVRTPLAGLHAALSYSKTPYIFSVACDTPFLSTPIIETLLDNIDTKSDVVVPESNGGLQPLCAVYARSCLPVIEKQLQPHVAATREDTTAPQTRRLNQGLKIINFFEKVRVKKIPESAFRGADPDGVGFFNVNTPEDMTRAEQILSGNQRS